MTIEQAIQEVDALVQLRRREFETRRLEVASRTNDLDAVVTAMVEFDRVVGDGWAQLAGRLAEVIAAAEDAE